MNDWRPVEAGEAAHGERSPSQAARDDANTTRPTPDAPVPPSPREKDLAIWRLMAPADFATLMNLAMGLAAIMVAIYGDPVVAIYIVFAAIIVDGIDGAVARLGYGGSPLGPMLDTLADAVTFVTAPAIIYLMLGWPSPGVVVVAFLYMCAGMLRLARFQQDERPYFLGLSTPGGAIVLGSVAIVAQGPILFIGGGLAACALMITTSPLPKLRGAIGMTGVAIILANLGIYLWIPQFAGLGINMQLLATGVYMALGPSHVRRLHGAA